MHVLITEVILHNTLSIDCYSALATQLRRSFSSFSLQCENWDWLSTGDDEASERGCGAFRTDSPSSLSADRKLSFACITARPCSL